MIIEMDMEQNIKKTFKIYEGEWRYDIRNGYGIFYFINGDKYIDEWKNNLKEGYGILYYSNGNKYEGQWKNDLMEGYGKLYSHDLVNMKVNSKMIRRKDQDYIIFQMEIYQNVNGKMVFIMDMEYSILHQDLSIKGILRLIYQQKFSLLFIRYYYF